MSQEIKKIIMEKYGKIFSQYFANFTQNNFDVKIIIVEFHFFVLVSRRYKRKYNSQIRKFRFEKGLLSKFNKFSNNN